MVIHKHYSIKEINTIIKLYKTHNNHEIAKILNRSVKGIGGKIETLGLKGRPSGSTIRKKGIQNNIEQKYGVPIKWLLETMHWTLDMPLRNGIDKKLGMSSTTIKEWMIEFNVKNRNISEDNYRRYEHMNLIDKQLQTTVANEHVRQNGQPKLIGKRGWSKGLNKNTHAGLMTSSIKHLGDKNPMYNLCGELSPNWKGGKKYWRGKRWGSIKKTVKTRDNYTCQECGITEIEWINQSGQPLQVHHIELYRINQNNNIENLITLCNSCHTKLDAVNLKNYEYKKEVETWIQNTLYQYEKFQMN